MPQTFAASVRGRASDAGPKLRRVIATLAVATTLPLVGSTAATGTASAASATATKRQFTSGTAHYATVTSPAESLSFAWDADTGVPSRFDWLHGGVAWYLHPDTPGRITRENPNVNYYDLDIRVTTAGFEASPNTLKGKLTVNVVARPDGATFAGVLEGTGSSWLVATGTLTDVG
jgi:hypothetical protein